MILDTDVLVDLLRGHPPAIAWFGSLIAPVAVCGFAALELAQGCVNKRELKRIRKVLAPFPLVWPNAADMLRAYDDYAGLPLSHGIGLLDALIATTAVGQGLPLPTFNVRHYVAIPGLTTVQPYMR